MTASSMARFQRGYVALSQAAAAAGSTFAYGEPGWVEIEAQLEKLGQLVSRLMANTRSVVSLAWHRGVMEREWHSLPCHY